MPIDKQSHVIFSSDDNRWGTPQRLFDYLNTEFHVSVDLCAVQSNAKCSRFFSPSENSLLQEWVGVCWMNPPYGKEIGLWMKKAFLSSQAGASVVCLVPVRTDARWFQRWVIGKASIRFIEGRLRFSGFSGNGHGDSAPFPSMIVIYDNKPPKIEALARSVWAAKQPKQPKLF